MYVAEKRASQRLEGVVLWNLMQGPQQSGRQHFGNAMSAKLRTEDRQAVDLLLDRMPTAATKGNGQSVYATASPTLRGRVERLQRLLQLLDLQEAIDTPRDLAARTLKRIESATHQHTGPSAIDVRDSANRSA
jgi:hypothetical protein